ncbi:hypothetical protein FRB99_002937 [Tulasnella sp. 403]|nr:hypothetical protein FRB99_002937 [Tulasnella sp. 403]
MRYLTFALSIIPLAITAPVSLVIGSFDTPHNADHTIASRMHNEQHSSYVQHETAHLYLTDRQFGIKFPDGEAGKDPEGPRPRSDPVLVRYYQLMQSLRSGLASHKIPYKEREDGQSINDYVHDLLGTWIANYQMSFGDPPVPLDLTQEAKVLFSKEEDLKYAMQNDPWRWMKTLSDTDPSVVAELNEAGDYAHDDKTRAFLKLETDIKDVAYRIGIRLQQHNDRVQDVLTILKMIDSDRDLYDTAAKWQLLERLRYDMTELGKALRQQS